MIGCKLCGASLNHLIYADDLCLMSPSVKGLQTLLNICQDYANEHDIIFNTAKTFNMAFIPKDFDLRRRPNLYLNGSVLKYAESVKYLGYYIYY